MSVLSRTRRWCAIAVLACVGGCVAIHAPPFLRPAHERQWPETLELAQERAQARDYDAADSILAAFATRYPGSAQAFESSYWRALYKMDPVNPHSSLSFAASALDAYIGNVKSQEHTAEAETLRRIAGQLSSLNKLAANAMTAPKEQPSAPAESKPNPDQASAADAEIRRLRDELAKANAELDRIKRRLAQPPGKPPR